MLYLKTFSYQIAFQFKTCLMQVHAMSQLSAFRFCSFEVFAISDSDYSDDINTNICNMSQISLYFREVFYIYGLELQYSVRQLY